jgi:hypothetical protein
MRTTDRFLLPAALGVALLVAAAASSLVLVSVSVSVLSVSVGWRERPGTYIM